MDERSISEFLTKIEHPRHHTCLFSVIKPTIPTFYSPLITRQIKTVLHIPNL